jgi:hypothetical protein
MQNRHPPRGKCFNNIVKLNSYYIKYEMFIKMAFTCHCYFYL